MYMFQKICQPTKVSIFLIAAKGLNLIKIVRLKHSSNAVIVNQDNIMNIST